jgi:excinuclease ABC subunit C
MSITTSPRPKPEAIPDHPGVYQFKDAAGRVIYVGKAISLRKRLASYFQPLRHLHPRTAAMVESSATVEWVLVQNEVEALQLEYNLIKQHRPRYNVRYRDDKSYPWLAVTVSEEIPRPRVERGAKRKGARYFGPYAHAYAIRETLDLLLRTFPMRTCSQGVFDRQRRLGRPCILYDINKCSGPCVGHITPEAHREIVEEFISFMEGRTRPVLRRLDEEMREAAEQLNFETAARLRDQLASVRKALERQQMVSSRPEDFDIAAFAEDDLEAAVQVFFVRRGRVVGQRGFVVDKVEELDTASLAATFVQQLYGERLDEVPREVLLPVLPDGADALRQWLSGVRGGPVDFRVPQRGEKRALLETVTANARDSFVTHKLKRASDFDARARALKELQEQLDLPVAPLRIECYDISNLQGSQVVGSMVVFEDGLPRKSEYRRFEVRTVDGQDDFASLREVLSRRLARLASEQDMPAEGAAAEVEPDGLHKPEGNAYAGSEAARGDDQAAGARADGSPGRKAGPRKFAYPPSLIVVDGGRPQLGAAMEALEQAGRTDLPVIGLAKRMEEVYVPGSPDPVVLPRASEALYLLQRVRDEAHRFAVAYHRKLRARSMTRSALDGIPGVGEARRKDLVRHFGSPRKVAQASVEEIAALPGFGERLARTVWDHLHGVSS